MGMTIVSGGKCELPAAAADVLRQPRHAHPHSGSAPAADGYASSSMDHGVIKPAAGCRGGLPVIDVYGLDGDRMSWKGRWKTGEIDVDAPREKTRTLEGDENGPGVVTDLGVGGGNSRVGGAGLGMRTSRWEGWGGSTLLAY
ncbi:hypothetical protein BU17DRAFT_66231 [Hysterangium stoloniferum]|nr:hypothetical protein BU17DRAFT_66231 [Hysterangium stoloniferum]